MSANDIRPALDDAFECATFALLQAASQTTYRAAVPHVLGVLRVRVESATKPAPREAIGKLVAWAMDAAVENGANSVSMPDELVEIAAWLDGVAS